MATALECALVVAANGPDYDPPVEVPRSLRQFTSFKKRVPIALTAAFRALDEDDEFRRRVAEDLTEEDLGRASFLFLNRPEGWEEELSALEADRFGRRVEKEAAREEQRAARRLREVEADLQKARSQLAELQAAAAGDREHRRSAAKAEAAARDALEHQKRGAAELERALERAGRERDEAISAAARLGDELAALRDRIERTPTVDVDLVKGSLASAASAVRSAADAIEAASRSLPQPAASREGQRPKEPSPRRPRREPLRLPGGVVDDSREAAEHLVRVPGVVLIVDGYNATHQIWEQRPIGEQRDRLVSALVELHARTGVDARVVFDGEEASLRDLPVRPGEPVRVTFSAEGVEADDVVIERVEQLPVSTPVLVATNDNRVRDACAKAGANLLTVEQLLAVLRR